jgi:hypothetical protein
MAKFLADENLKGSILRGLFRRQPEFDVVRVQDVGLSGADDSTLLEWAAQHGRIVLTHDVSTMSRDAYRRGSTGLPMPGVIEIGRRLSPGQAIEDILTIAEASVEGEWEGQVLFLPL